MKTLRFVTFLPSLLAAASLLVGCGHKEDGGHGEEAPSGAFFKAGKGVIITEETTKILGVEITDGLLAGDQVVTKPVETLWLIELRATKGGGHSH